MGRVGTGVWIFYRAGRAGAGGCASGVAGGGGEGEGEQQEEDRRRRPAPLVPCCLLPAAGGPRGAAVPKARFSLTLP